MKHLSLSLLLFSLVIGSSVSAGSNWVWGVDVGYTTALQLTGLKMGDTSTNWALLIPENNRTMIFTVTSINENVIKYLATNPASQTSEEVNTTISDVEIIPSLLTLTIPEGLPIFIPLQTPTHSDYLDYYGNLFTTLSSMEDVLLGFLGIEPNTNITLDLDANYTLQPNLEINLFMNLSGNLTGFMSNDTITGTFNMTNSDTSNSNDMFSSIMESFLSLNYTNANIGIQITMDYDNAKGELTSFVLAYDIEAMTNTTMEPTSLTGELTIKKTTSFPGLNTEDTQALKTIASSVAKNPIPLISILSALIMVPYVKKRISTKN